MRSRVLVAIALLGMTAASGLGQTKLPIQQAIEAQFPLTKPTADHKDMVTAGAVIDLMKDNLEMNDVTAPIECRATYKDGKFETNGTCKVAKVKLFGISATGGKAGSNRTFVAGEKFWLIKVDVQDKAAVLEFLSDPVSDVRYRALVTYPYPGGTIPAPNVMVAMIKESIKAEPVDGKGGDDQAAQAAAPAPAPAPAPPPAKMADIPPPPPPADTPPPAPKSISLGQTKDQVTANFGPPTKVVNLPNKEIDYYPDMKVTFVKGKVTDVQ